MERAMSLSEFRAILAAAHQAAVYCIVNARNLRFLILQSSVCPPDDTIACHVIAIERRIEEVRTTGRALGKAYRENIDGTLSGWVATSPIKEHEDVIDAASSLVRAIAAGFPQTPKENGSDGSVTEWYSLQVRKRYSAIRERVKKLTQLDGFRHQADLARVHDAALKEWIALLTGTHAKEQPPQQGTAIEVRETPIPSGKGNGVRLSVGSDRLPKKKSVRTPRNPDELKRAYSAIKRGKRRGETKGESVRNHVEQEYPKLTTEGAIVAKTNALLRRLNDYKDLYPL
jgi:hypothetical protein